LFALIRAANISITISPVGALQAERWKWMEDSSSVSHFLLLRWRAALCPLPSWSSALAPVPRAPVMQPLLLLKFQLCAGGAGPTLGHSGAGFNKL